MRPNDVTGLLVSALTDWAGYIANPRFIRNGNVITWNNNAGQRLGEPVTPDDVREMAEAGQYTFQIVEDGALIQMLYEFDAGQELVGGMLGYYGFGSYDEHDFPDFVKWLRFDYSPAHQRGVLHHDSHLHISFFSETRVPVCGFPNPKQFLEMVMAFCYPATYRSHRLSQDGTYVDLALQRAINDPCVGLNEHDVFSFMSHLAVPRHP